MKSFLHSLLKKINLLRASFSTFQLATLLSFKESLTKKNVKLLPGGFG